MASHRDAIERRVVIGGRWVDQPERGNATWIALTWWVCRWFGREGARLFTLPAVMYFALFGGAPVRASRVYLQRMFGRARIIMVFRHLRAFMDCVVDRVFFRQGRFDGFEIQRVGHEHLWRLHAERRGALLIGAHLGSFDAMRTLSRASGFRINVVAHFVNAPMINTFLQRIDPDSLSRVIEIDPENPGWVLTIAERIAAGEMVAVLGDRTGLGERSVSVEFLGGRARFPVGPYTLAAALGCSVYLVFGLYQPPRRYRLFCEPFAERIVLPREGREQVIRDHVCSYARRLEHYCRLAPYDWFNFYDFWAR